MDWLTFISTVIRDISWPLVCVAGAFFIIKYGRNIVRVIKSIKYKDFELTIKEDLENARADAEQLKLEQPEGGFSSVDPNDKLLQLAKIDPALAVVDIWKPLEAALIQLIQHNGLVRYASQEKFIVELQKQEKISAVEADLYRKLRRVRNQSVHSDTKSVLSASEVFEFKEYADVLIRRFQHLLSQPSYIDINTPKHP